MKLEYPCRVEGWLNVCDAENMALCQHGTVSSSSSELREFITEDESAIGDNISIFEPLSDSCGESDMEGLDFSLFEPQVEPNCCHQDSRVCSGMLDLLMHYCEPECCVSETAGEACWEPCYCVLLQDEQTLTAYRSEDMALFAGTGCIFRAQDKIGDAMFVELPRVRLDGGARAFRQYWGYESRPLAPPPPLIEEDEGGIEPETVSLREANTASPIGKLNYFIFY
ncbi:GSCOCG00007615001-RA-CDS [Cotesia congregata]|nr:GSCOCG00007615001-RA-CDS [Cotesia congregata]